MNKNVCGLKNIKLLLHVYDALVSVNCLKDEVNPFAPEPPVTARADPGPFYPL